MRDVIGYLCPSWFAAMNRGAQYDAICSNHTHIVAALNKTCCICQCYNILGRVAMESTLLLLPRLYCIGPISMWKEAATRTEIQATCHSWVSPVCVWNPTLCSLIIPIFVQRSLNCPSCIDRASATSHINHTCIDSVENDLSRSRYLQIIVQIVCISTRHVDCIDREGM